MTVAEYQLISLQLLQSVQGRWGWLDCSRNLHRTLLWKASLLATAMNG